jgi:hypothetical protein
MTYSASQPISGTAAGVPFTALPPRDDAAPAPLVVIWHLMDPPCTVSAMAAALPMTALPSWRLYLGLPLTGRRLPASGFEELMRLGAADAVVNLFGPILSQAADEAPAAVAAVRTAFGIASGPIGVAGGSLGGGVAIEVIAARVLPVSAAALVNSLVRVPGAVAASERVFDFHYGWTDASRAVADRFDFLRRATEIATAERRCSWSVVATTTRSFAPTLGRWNVSSPAAIRTARACGCNRVPGMLHHLAEPPGIESSPPRSRSTSDRLAGSRAHRSESPLSGVLVSRRVCGSCAMPDRRGQRFDGPAG